jgi:Uma2 family endonuclease
MRAGTIDLLGLEMPIVLRPSAPVSDLDLMRFSAHNPYKIERNKEGELTIITPLGGIGGTHEKYVVLKLGIWTEQDGRGIDFSPSTGFKLPDGSCLQPDASWISLERWNALSRTQQEGFPPLCPDFVIDVRSKTDRRKPLEAKMQLWLDNGAKLAWLVDPIEKSVSIYCSNQPVETLSKPEIVRADAPVAGFELVCAPLWL